MPLTLTSLNLSHNQLTSLDSIGVLCHLQELDVGYNFLTSLDGLVPVHRTIQTVVARNNRIRSLSGVEALKSLRALDVQNNDISHLEDLRPLGSLRLERLGIKGNKVALLTPCRSFCVGLIPTLALLDGEKTPTPLSPAKRSGRLALLQDIRRFMHENDQQEAVDVNVGQEEEQEP